MTAMSEPSIGPTSRLSWRTIAGAPETTTPSATIAIAVFAVAMFAVHAFQLFTFTLPSGQFRNLHLAFSLVIGFLALAETLKPGQNLFRVLAWIATALAVVVAI